VRCRCRAIFISAGHNEFPMNAHESLCARASRMAYARARRQPHAQAADVGAEPSSILPRSDESAMKSPASGKGLWGNRSWTPDLEDRHLRG
jgi:hypothetical protein